LWRRRGASAPSPLRLDVHDLAPLERLPGIRYLHVRSDGRPPLDPIASLTGLRALIIETSALRGDLDPLAFADLRWLRIGLGGKGGAAVLPAIQRGHPSLEWLAVGGEIKARVATDFCAGFPNLRVLHIGCSELRELGDLAAAAPKLEKVALDFTQIATLDGLSGLQQLETLELRGGRVRDLGPLRSLRRLRYARLELTDLESFEPLRDHPALRMVMLWRGQEPDHSVLASIRGLKAVRLGKGFERWVLWPGLGELPVDDPLRVEWSRAMAE
jgi:Leucine-rich repeat (LRR) protein